MATSDTTTPTATAFDDAVAQVAEGGVGAASTAAQQLLDQLTDEERRALTTGNVKVWQGLTEVLVQGYGIAPFAFAAAPRLGIPGLRFTDGPRGVVTGTATAFPTTMCRGATWDTELERAVGLAIGLEARARNANLYGGVCVNLPRHPAWGRVQETYGEDPLLLGEMGAALTAGVQRNVMACVKHYACNSMENARFFVDVRIDDAALHEVYLAHFKRIIDAGVHATMSAYNRVNGEWCGHSAHLLTDILRHQWHFQGFVVSDFVFGIRDAAVSLKNGMDVEAPFAQLRPRGLVKALAAGTLQQADIDRAGLRVLTTLLKHYVEREPAEPTSEVIFCRQHRDLARTVAQSGITLLQNEAVQGSPLLPLSREAVSKIAVLGRLADVENTGDEGSSVVQCPHVVTPWAGIQAALPSTCTAVLNASDDVDSLVASARESDVAILIVGYTHEDEGEKVAPELGPGGAFSTIPWPSLYDIYHLVTSVTAKWIRDRWNKAPRVPGPSSNSQGGGDRVSLRLRPNDVEIINAVAKANSRTIVCVISAGAVLMGEWRHNVPAVVMAWYNGTEGGNALADVLFGEVDAGGRLPYSIPTDEKHLPFFDRKAKSITYDRWFGQRLLDRLNVQPEFPLGHGLSYTTFSHSLISMSDITTAHGEHSTPDQASVKLRVKVTNTGQRAGKQVVQIYGCPRPLSDDFPSRVLLGFTRVHLGAGSAAEIEILASLKPLMRWVKDVGFEYVGQGAEIEIASFAGDPECVTTHLDFGVSRGG